MQYCFQIQVSAAYRMHRHQYQVYGTTSMACPFPTFDTQFTNMVSQYCTIYIEPLLIIGAAMFVLSLHQQIATEFELSHCQ